MRAAILIAALLAPSLSAMVVGPGGVIPTASLEIAATLINGQSTLLIRATVQAGDSAQPAWLILPLDQPVASARATAEGPYRQLADRHEYAMGVARTQWREKTDLSLPFLRGETRPTKPDPVITQATDREVTSTGDIVRYDSLADLLGALEELGLSAPVLPEVAQGGCYVLLPMLIPAGTDSHVRLPVLEIKLDSGEIPLPVRTFGGSGLALHVLSDRPLAGHPWAVARDRLKAASSGYVQMMNLWTTQPPPSSPASPAADHDGRWFINRMLVTEIPQLEADLVLPGGGLSDEIPGFWYYGDGETTWLESLFRRHGLALVFTTGALLFGSLLVSNAIHRRRKLTAPRRA